MKKSTSIGVLLAWFFSSFGVLYTSSVGFLPFFILDIVVGLLLGSGINVVAIFVGVVFLIIRVIWVQDVIEEHNQRIENKITPMTSGEILECGFKNIFPVLINILMSLFLTCFLYAILSLSGLINKLSITWQAAVFFIPFLIIGILYSLKSRDDASYP